MISDVPIRKYGRSYVKVKCTCGSNLEKDLPILHFVSKQSLGCEKCSRFHTTQGVGLLSGEYWAIVKNGARRRNIIFDITKEEAWEIYLKQNGKCNLTGLDIPFEPNCTHKKGQDNRSKRIASLDRIDSAKGYIISNIQWVHKDVNLMKNYFDENYFKKICELVWKKI